MAKQLIVIRGDITRLAVDAIVNAANNTLLGGAGVDGAIHKAAGPELRRYCAMLGGCPTGESRLTPGFYLLARYVIHTVGPVWMGGASGEEELLGSCYKTALTLAQEQGFSSVAFPCISCGVYRFPLEKACRIAVRAVTNHPFAGNVVFCCFNEAARIVYAQTLANLGLPYAESIN